MTGHIRQQGKGSWELKFDLGRDPMTGRRAVWLRILEAVKELLATRPPGQVH